MCTVVSATMPSVRSTAFSCTQWIAPQWTMPLPGSSLQMLVRLARVSMTYNFFPSSVITVSRNVVVLSRSVSRGSLPEEAAAAAALELAAAARLRADLERMLAASPPLRVCESERDSRMESAEVKVLRREVFCFVFGRVRFAKAETVETRERLRETESAVEVSTGEERLVESGEVEAKG